jgi:GTP:adenosylcobinamide-phosphate guanylyltransferase
MSDTTNKFTGVVLAGDRGPDDPVARNVGAPCKSFAPLGGRPMVLRVLDTLAEAREIDSLVVCGPAEALLPQEPELCARITAGTVRWVPPQATPSTSTYHVLEGLSPHAPVLVTTADHAFLTAEVVDYFCLKARASDYDVVVGLASHAEVMAAFPQTKRTATRLRDGGFCSCNLFAFLSPRARAAAEFWRQCERNRKKPWKMMRVIGWGVVVRYLLGALSLEEGVRRLSARMNVKAGAVILPFPDAAVDVDTVKDWRLVEEVLSRRRERLIL